jgi:hypothetical protein
MFELSTTALFQETAICDFGLLAKHVIAHGNILLVGIPDALDGIFELAFGFNLWTVAFGIVVINLFHKI